MILRKAYSYIRMSTDSQLKGDSLRRQLDASKAYAENHNLELVDNIDGILLNDIGISAFKSKNTQKGVLSNFLDALDNNKIPKNSVLLIESLDRLSRDKLSEALSQFMSILNKGVEIVTLADNQVYTKEIINQNPGALFVSLGIMFRANEESEMKSKRLKAVWEVKRKNAADKPLSRKCPGWIRFNETTGKFEIIEERADVVKTIYDMCINTSGFYSIARFLNTNHIPTFGGARLWTLSYIKRVLTTRMVLGEYQPETMIEGKREKIGDPIYNYYPKILDEQSFLLAQVNIAKRATGFRGRKGKSFNNIFTGFSYCGSCGGKMFSRGRKGVNKKATDILYLICTNSRGGLGCETHTWRLPELEQLIFRHLREINFEDVMVNTSDVEKVSLDDQIEAVLQNILMKEQEIERAVDFVLGNDVSPEIKHRLQLKTSQLEEDKKTLRLQVEELKKEKAQAKDITNLTNSVGLVELLDQIDEHADDYFFRSKLNHFLSKFIDRIEFYEETNYLQPWELSDNSPVISEFRKSHKVRANKTFEEVINNHDFETFNRNFNKKIKVIYKSGIERFILCGEAASITL